MREVSDRPRVVIAGPPNLGPHHLARYNALDAAGLDVRVACCPRKEFHRPWKFESEKARFAVDYPFGTKGGAVNVLREAGVYLLGVRPDVVILVGYNSPYYWAMVWHCRRRQIPVLLYLVGAFGERRRRLVKELGKGLVCRVAFSGALATGGRSVRYARFLGIPRENIWSVGNAIDNEHFGSVGESCGDRRSFLYVGRISPEKNLDRLVEAFRRYRLAGGTWSLRLVGTGPERERVAAMVEGDDAIELQGWSGYESLPNVYADAGALILPSLIEPWGLVVNEGMAAGLPVLVSRKCGCYPELCRDGVNGFGLEPKSVESMSEAMLRMELLGPAKQEEMGLASRKMVAAFSVETWAAGVSNSVRLMFKREGVEGGGGQ